MRYKDLIEDIVVKASDHPTVDRIYMAAKQITPKISMATVYNNLKTLTNEGKIRKIPMDDGGDCYDKTLPHAHLVCVDCGRVEDTIFDDLTAELATKTEKDILFYDLKIMYLCDECKNTELI